MSLHDKIMNLPVAPTELAAAAALYEGETALAYKLGHRDARHAAAEMADEAETAAYAEGRADERAEWLPVLEALKTLVGVLWGHGALTADGCFTDDPKERMARAAIASVEGKS